jgi:hypothetical protein
MGILARCTFNCWSDFKSHRLEHRRRVLPERSAHQRCAHRPVFSVRSEIGPKPGYALWIVVVLLLYAQSDQRTVRHQGYKISQTKRPLIERVFGWMKQAGGCARLNCAA